ncbi:hypothetical protein, partial [Streptomyces sp. NPDC089919]|uniref:hypothetical protein n=1 Tax=Streptomyces sp. NPDC089919 TaxID=3155188 RepID=UPI0034144377
MLVAAAVCPAPPLLVPEVASGAAQELAAARTACSDALSVLAAARPDRLVVVGPGDQGKGNGTRTYPQGTPGSFRPFGVELDVRLGQGEGRGRGEPLPTPLAVAAWLLTGTGWTTPVEGLGVDPGLAPEDCLAAGRELTAGPGRVALLVMKPKPMAISVNLTGDKAKAGEPVTVKVTEGK